MAGKGHVVLIHAFPLSADVWDPIRDRVPEGWSLVTPDLPGFGSSTEPPARTMEEMAASVLAALDAAGVHRAVIGGMSMGGYVTLALLRMAPHRFAGLVLVDTRATADNAAQRDARKKMIATAREKGPSAVADDMLPKLLGDTSKRERPEVAAVVRRLIEANRADAITGAVEAMLTRPDSTRLLASIDLPTLIVCGQEDTLTPPTDSEALRQGIAGSRLVLLPKSGHLPSLETPEQFSEALASFLASLSTGQSR